MLGLRIHWLDLRRLDACYIDRWNYIWDQIRHTVMLYYAVPEYNNGVPIFKTYTQK